MKILDMPWEKDNIGVNSVEFRFDGTEEISQIDCAISTNNFYDYQVCRIPANSMKLAYFLQEKGFKYSETAFELTADLREDKLPVVYKKYIDFFSYHEADSKELSLVDKTIREGIFDTDRIALDDYFGIDKSGNRFGNWCKQELERGSSKCYIVKTSTSPLGFFVLKHESESISDSFLAALFKKENMGLGFSVLYYPFIQARKERKKKIITRVSSNNIVSLKTHLEIGYKINKLNYLFIKHKDLKNKNKTQQ